MTSPGGECVAVVHPQKSGGVAAATEQLAEWAHKVGQPAPHVVATTAESPGTEQARSAVAAGADLVLAWGGDGTVNSVAAGLAGTDVALGILPAGTGNLLARNLGIPLRMRDAAAVALTGEERRIDLIDIGLGGRVTTCSVMAGIGLDAVLIDAPEDLKNVIGPTAYVVNGIRAVGHRTTRFGVAVDGARPHWFSAKSVLVANVGGLVAGLDLAPEAEVADGLLHVVVLPLGTPLDLLRTGTDLALRRPRNDRSRRHYAGRSVVIVSRETQPRQVDGDVVDEGRRLEARVRPGALLVRVPR
ncbi:MAG: diacylglycerol kinase family protein [Candidatus Nanopelagicales bacterium]